MRQSRRVFLARATGVALAAAVAALGCERRAPAAADTAAPGDKASTTTPPALDEATRATLLLIAQRLFPHPEAPADWYAIVVEALNGAAAQTPAVASMLTTGIAELHEAGSGDFAARSPDEQTSALAAIEATPFFQTVRATSVFTFYNQPKVWQAFGYEGDAWAKGGYLARGLSDIKWLPEPGATSPRAAAGGKL
jgi:hypothetical protein